MHNGKYVTNQRKGIKTLKKKKATLDRGHLLDQTNSQDETSDHVLMINIPCDLCIVKVSKYHDMNEHTKMFQNDQIGELYLAASVCDWERSPDSLPCPDSSVVAAPLHLRLLQFQQSIASEPNHLSDQASISCH